MQTAQNDHGQPRQQDRRRLAERRDPGQQRDRHPARRRPRPGEGRGDHRLDRQAAVLRLREGSRGADRQPDGNPTPYPTALLPPHSGAGPGEQRARRRRTTSSAERRRSRTTVKGKKVTKTTTEARDLQGRRRRGNSFSPPYGGKKPAGTRSLRCRRTAQVVHGAHEQATQPVKQSPNNGYWYLFKYFAGRAGRAAGDHRQRPQRVGDPGRHRAEHGQPEVALGFKGHGGEAVPEDHEGRVRPRPVAAGLNGSAGHDSTSCTRSTTRSCSTGSSSRRRTSTTPTQLSARDRRRSR